MLPPTSAATTLFTTASWSSASIDEATSLVVDESEQPEGLIRAVQLTGKFRRSCEGF